MKFFVTERGRILNVKQIVEIEVPDSSKNRKGSLQMSNGTYVELSNQDIKILADILELDGLYREEDFK